MGRHNSSGSKFSAHASDRPVFATSIPKFQSIGDGILQHINGKDKIVRGEDNRWESLSARDVIKSNATPPLSPPEKDVIIF